MPLVTCPDCNREISDAAAVCIGCGRPMTPVPTLEHAIPQSQQGSQWQCPKCGGTELKKFSLLYEEQRSNTSPNTAGMSVGVRGAKSTEVVITDVARKVAAPDKSKMMAPSGGAAVALVAAVVAGYAAYKVSGGVGLAVGAFVVVFIGGAMIASRRKGPAVNERYTAALDRWTRSFLCMRCGATILQEGLRFVVVGEDWGEVDALLRSGHKIQAVRVTRDRDGIGLKEAKNAVEDRARTLGLG